MPFALRCVWAFALLLPGILVAQGPDKEALKLEKQYLKTAEEHYGYEEFRQAVPYYQQAVAVNPNNADSRAKLGECLINSGQKQKALEHLREANRLNPAVHPRLDFFYANALHASLKTDEAEKYYQQYLAKLKSNDPDYSRCQLLLTQVRNARRLVKDSINVIIENAGPNVNSAYPDYVPVISADEDVMIFTSRRPENIGELDISDNLKYEDLYISRRLDKKTWSPAINMGMPINSKFHEATSSLSADGQTLYLYRDVSRSVYQCKLQGRTWSEPKPVSDAVTNRRSWQEHACESADGQWLFFTSDRPGGQGGIDIYYCQRQGDGTWGEPLNAGPVINTPFDERGPFLHPDGRTLYFSSQGHSSMGGLDIFVSIWDRDKATFSTPKNIGYPVNTAEDDVYFVMAANGKTAYYASSRFGGFGDKDIYRITFKPKKFDLDLTSEQIAMGAEPTEALSVPKSTVTILKGTITDAITKKPVEARLILTDNEANRVVAENTSNSASGNYLLALPAGKNYGLAVEAEGYLFHSENFIIPKSADYQEIVKNVELQPIEIGKRIVLKNIFFDFDKSTLRPESKAELERLKQILVENPGLKIRINGHTDSDGSDEYNLKLSDSRSKSVVEYLIAAGIARERLIWKGFGEGQPIDTNDTPEGRQNNRRTEFEILSVQ